MTISIHPVTTVEECQQIEHIMRVTWGGDAIVVPQHLSITIATQNGCVLLAVEDGEPIGFCLGFTAFVGQNASDPALRLKHHSHMAGVMPTHQGRGIGSLIKWAQRDFVLQTQHIEQMTWTYDPLELANARLNIHKLGAVAQTYKRNVYGSSADPLNTGVQTDRFIVDWWLASQHVAQHKTGTYRRDSAENRLANGTPCLNKIVWKNSLPYPDSIDLSHLQTAETVLLTIPNNFQMLKKQDLALAQAWRIHTRNLFEPAFAANFVVIDVLRTAEQGYYLLQKDWVVE